MSCLQDTRCLHFYYILNIGSLLLPSTRGVYCLYCHFKLNLQNINPNYLIHSQLRVGSLLFRIIFEDPQVYPLRLFLKHQVEPEKC